MREYVNVRRLDAWMCSTHIPIPTPTSNPKYIICSGESGRNAKQKLRLNPFGLPWFFCGDGNVVGKDNQFVCADSLAVILW